MASSKLVPPLQEQLQEARDTCEHFHQANLVAGEILGALIPQVNKEEQHELYHRLGVLEDILAGASERYTT